MIPSMRRFRNAILVLLAAALAPAGAVRGAWRCPDGTPCVSAPGSGYRCEDSGCAAPSCCADSPLRHCRHGELPEVGPPPGAGASLRDLPHCTYTLYEAPRSDAREERQGSVAGGDTAAALPRRGRTLPPAAAAVPFVRSAAVGRPPPLGRAASPRAPPLPRFP